MISGPQGLYYIEAKAPAPITEDVCKLMVQALLADRFKMAVHKEAREMPVYALVVGKNGLKTQKASESESVSGVSFVTNGKPLGVARGASKSQQQGPAGWTMDFLVDMLTAPAGRPVFNKTGLEGIYRINLSFSTSNATSADFQPPPETGPDIRTALEEQMGLKLEPMRAPVEVVVIDHFEKPSAN